MYSPAAIEIAPEIRPATHVIKRVLDEAPLAAIPKTRLVTEIIPSFAPKTEALNQPARCI